MSDKHTWDEGRTAWIVTGTTDLGAGRFVSSSSVIFAKNEHEAQGLMLQSLQQQFPMTTSSMTTKPLDVPVDWNRYHSVTFAGEIIGWIPAYITELYEEKAISWAVVERIARRTPTDPLARLKAGKP